MNNTICSGQSKPRMNKKRVDFIKHYIITKNATEAARLAGYKPSNASLTGHRLLRNARIVGEIEARFKEIDAKYNYNQETIRKKLIDEAERASKASDRIRALELLGKDHGMFKESIQSVVGIFNQLGQESPKIEPIICNSKEDKELGK